MITPPVMQGLTNENTMLSGASIEDLEEYKKNVKYLEVRRSMLLQKS